MSTAYLEVNYECGVDVMGRDCESGPMDPSILDNADYIIICAGKKYYAKKMVLLTSYLCQMDNIILLETSEKKL